MQDTNIESLEGEIWKDIPGYEGKHIISNFGRIFNIHRGKFTSYFYRRGYRCVVLHNKGQKHFSIHRLIATVFIPKNNDKLVVNHKNGIKDDNRIENLEWVTYSENNAHAYRIGLKKPYIINKGKLGSLHHCSVKVVQMDLSGNKIREFGSIIDATRDLGIHQTSISKCCIGKVKTAGGYKWEYII